MDIGSSLSAITSVPLDWIILCVLFLIIAADSMRAGPGHAGALALSLPVTLVLFQLIPQTMFLGSITAQFSNSIEQAVIFAIIEAVLFVCANQMLYSFDHYSSLLMSAVVGLATTIIVLVMWIEVPALQSIWHFDPEIQVIFGTSYRFFWLLGSYLALAFAAA